MSDRRMRHLTPSERQALEEDEQIFEQDDLESADVIAREMRSADQLVQKAALRRQVHNAMNDRAPFVRINPVSVLKGTLGGQQQVTPGTNLQVAWWQGEDAEALPLVATLAPVQQLLAIDSGIAVLRPYAILQFGTRGFLVKAEVDIGTGCQVVVGASSMTIQVALEAIPNGFGGTAGFMKLAGMISFYPSERVLPNTRTRYVDSLAGNSSADYIVPPFAKSVIFWREPRTEPFELDFLINNGGIVYSFAAAANVVMTDPIQLSPDIIAVRVKDTSGGGLNGRLIFNLDI